MEISQRDVLLVVDVQNDFVSGTLAIPGAGDIIGPINRLARAFDHVVVTTDWHPPDHVSFASAHPGAQHGDVVPVFYGEQMVYHDHCVAGSWGAELAPGLDVGKARLILRKGYRPGVESNGCFYENDGVTRTGLTGYLRMQEVERVFCTGLARFGCVMQSALGAARDGFAVFMVDDASIGGPPPGPEEEKRKRQLAEAGIGWVHSRDLL